MGGNSIYRSTNGGSSWQKVYESADVIENIAMGSSSNAIFVSGAYNGKLITTFDGGNSFDSVSLADNLFTDVFFAGPSTAYTVGRHCWKTVNGGHTWKSLYDFSLGYGGGGYKSLHFINEKTGWMTAPPGLFTTTDSGANWELHALPIFSLNNTGNVYYTDVNNGYVSDVSSVGKTSNGGTSWNKVLTTNNNTYHDLHFITKDLGYVSDGGIILKTTDGGATWTKEVTLAKENLIELHFTDINHGWACGNNGTILKYER